MLRLRRYRVFLVFAFIAVAALYRFGTSAAAWREAASDAATGAGFKTTGGEKTKPVPAPGLDLDTPPRPVVAIETKSLRLDIPAATQPHVPQTPPPVQTKPTPAAIKSVQKPSIPSPQVPQQHDRPVGDAPPDDNSELALASSIPPIHWSKLPEQFPVASTSLLRLPTGKPKPIPKIQFAFKPESAEVRADRLAKLDVIRDVAKKSWDGYKQFAWLHDELKPESGTFRDPFANWGATLVDSLDTLWIMGLKEDFEEAVKAVAGIDFTTTTRPDIPLFETTIRYLGGLVAAYDISGNKYQILLDKAVELAEVLISAFDTPNRMPETYYYWRPQFASQRHRAGKNIVLAEVGSLSMEFTRLAQLTGQDKYYDAVARITDNLEAMQMESRLPGMWPTKLDISGCGSMYQDLALQSPLNPPEDYLHNGVSSDIPTAEPVTKGSLSPDGHEYVALDLPKPVLLTSDDESSKMVEAKGRIQDWQGRPLEEDKRYIPLDLPEPVVLDSAHAPAKDTTGSAGAEKHRISSHSGASPLEKRQIDNVGELAGETLPDQASSAEPALPTPPDCKAQGFKSATRYGYETYTLGGESDSTYEYLPKEYLLLGGQVEKYRTMYEASADVWKKHLFFRPMLPENKDILFSGQLNLPPDANETKFENLRGENAHLTCFVGGMLGMGAKIFNRPEDLTIAEKLTEGCVWSYDMTASGIMPESFDVITCQSTEDCAWNQTAYWDALDPQADYRQDSYSEQLKAYESNLASASAWYEAELAAMTPPPNPSQAASFDAQATPMTAVWADTLDRRQLPDLLDDAEIAHMPSVLPSLRQDRDTSLGGESEAGKFEQGESPPTKVQPLLDTEESKLPSSPTQPQFPYLMSPYPPVSHKDYVESRIQEERLPPGVTKIGSRHYILRPEAIESVWYMYRITGSAHWREAGWRMFQAINKHTSTKYGSSAIEDVTMHIPPIKDEMESFWLAETLKYFYLLFSEEDVVSLDDWVLNTEAHPFKRPT